MSVLIKVEPLNFPWQTQDPFLFCAHHRDEYPKGNGKMGPDDDLKGRSIGSDFTVKDGWRMYHGKTIPGFPYHPHRGFETITINKEGVVDHFDSLGATGRFGAGDVQWMTAGKGVQHSEMFPMVHEDKENPLEIFQIWLNLPRAKKFAEPNFKMLWAESVPTAELIDASGKKTWVDVIAGEIAGEEAPAPAPDSWAASADNNVAVWTIKMEPGAVFDVHEGPSDVNRTFYFYRGSAIEINGEKIGNYYAAQVKPDEAVQLVNGQEEGYLLMLQGKPINEPVAQYGPFVMNSEAEIQQAFADYRRTEFGGWPWPATEVAHPATQGRFAKYPDGTVEEK